MSRGNGRRRKRQVTKQKQYRRLVGPVELPMTDAELVADAARQLRASRRHGVVVVGTRGGALRSSGPPAPAG